MVEQIYEFLTLIIRKGPEFIAVGFLGFVGGVTLTAFGPRWLRRLLMPQIIESDRAQNRQARAGGRRTQTSRRPNEGRERRTCSR